MTETATNRTTLNAECQERKQHSDQRFVKLRVLVACEFSGRVRDCFAAAGHDAWSCDLLPSEGPGNHIQGDILPLLNDGWDLMIAHPPCTHLAVSGARWFKEKQAEQAAALEFVRKLMDAPIPHIAIENPVSIISSRIRRPDQIVQPWMFGHGETKTTCLWLKNLPKLEPTDVVVPEWAVRQDGTIHLSAKVKRDNPTHFLTGRTTRILKGAQLEQWERIHKEPPGPERWKNRSRTYLGIAAAMATQWGGYLAQLNDKLTDRRMQPTDQQHEQAMQRRYGAQTEAAKPIQCSALLADVVSYITDQSKQFRQCAGHHAERNPGAEAVAYRAAEILDRIAADIKSANARLEP